VISCVYCGGEHERPVEVKQCWTDQQTDQQGAATLAGAEIPVEPALLDPTAAPQNTIDGDAATVAIRRGPTELGRNVVVAAGEATPNEWDGCERVVIDATVLANPNVVVDLLRAAAGSVSVVIELGCGFDSVPDESSDRPAYELGVEHSFFLDELHHLVWSNSIDARGDGRWPIVDRALTLGARLADSADLILGDGTEVWVDAGPIGYRDPIDGYPVLHAVQIEHGRLGIPLSNACGAELAPDQLAAVTHASGSARIIAPAGSGKTRVLTERSRHLVANWRLPAPAVTLVAFNKRAQEEMSVRTGDLDGLDVRTLNSLALSIVNGRQPFAPQVRRWRTIDEPEVRRLLSQFVNLPRRRNTDPLAPWIDALSLLRLGLVPPGEVEARYGGDVDGLAEVWPLFADALDRAGAIDFDDQIRRAIDVLLTQPSARRAAQRVCRVLLVDEFQDLTPAHLLLIRLLAGPAGAVFGVGDDDQTIYGYNGADPAWLIDFARWFPGAGDHPLEVNYRCPAGVVDVADRLLRHNWRRVDKTIRAASTDTGGWTAVESDDPVEVTLNAVSAAISAGSPEREIAVLTRVNTTIAPVQAALVSAGIGVRGGVGTEFLTRTAVRAALAWMRLASGTSFDPVDLSEALRRPSRPLHPRIGDWVAEQRDVDALRRLAGRLTNERDATRVEEFADDVTRIQALRAAGNSTGRLMDVLIDEIGLGGAVATLDNHRHGMNRAAQGDDLIALRQLAQLQPEVERFENWLRDRLSAPRTDTGVTLSTVHRVKGQEWPHVVVHLSDADQFPHRLSDDVEEERRLFHVAITRASRHATIVSGSLPSPFVSELTSEPPAQPPPEERQAPVERRRASSAPRRAPSDHPLLERERVIAVPGLVLVDQGQEWTITELEPEAAVAELGGASRRFVIGSKVVTAGKQRGRLGARPGEVTESAARLYDLLRSYRDRVRAGKPAYTVFDDKTLAAISTATPSDLAELSRVKGVGPAKLEQYGDDVLELAATASDG